jgi:hypothetical protein
MNNNFAFAMVLRESGLSRIQDSLSKYDCGTITAFKDKDFYRAALDNIRKSGYNSGNETVRVVVEPWLKAEGLTPKQGYNLLADDTPETRSKPDGVSPKKESVIREFNLDRNKMLVKELMEKGYSVTAIDGVGQEEVYKKVKGKRVPDEPRAVSENSYFVVDRSNKGTLRDDLIALGNKYQQWGVAFIPAGEKNGELISCDSGEIDSTLDGRKYGTTGGSPFYSKKGNRPFVF